MYTYTTRHTPLGNIFARVENGLLCGIKIDDESRTSQAKKSPLFEQLRTELGLYFMNKQFRFSLPLDLHGTAFQQRVWQALRQIPVGQTCTYGQLAAQLNSSARAVGNACRANPVPIIIPCHRVIAKHGIGGYDGQTHGSRLNIKRWLLTHEGICLN